MFVADVYSNKTRKPIIVTFCLETRRGYAKGIRCIVKGIADRVEQKRLALELENALDNAHMQLLGETFVPTLRWEQVQIDPALKHRGISVRWAV